MSTTWKNKRNWNKDEHQL